MWSKFMVSPIAMTPSSFREVWAVFEKRTLVRSSPSMWTPSSGAACASTSSRQCRKGLADFYISRRQIWEICASGFYSFCIFQKYQTPSIFLQVNRYVKHHVARAHDPGWGRASVLLFLCSTSARPCQQSSAASLPPGHLPLDQRDGAGGTELGSLLPPLLWSFWDAFDLSATWGSKVTDILKI